MLYKGLCLLTSERAMVNLVSITQKKDIVSIKLNESKITFV